MLWNVVRETYIKIILLHCLELSSVRGVQA